MRAEQLRSVLTDTLVATEPPFRGGPAEVFARARKMQRRRRLGSGASVAAAVAAVSALTFAVTAGRTDSAEPAASPAPSAQARLSPKLARLAALLPPGVTFTRTEPDLPNEGERIAALDQAGMTYLFYSVQHSQDAGECGDPRDVVCHTEMLTNGSTVIVLERKPFAVSDVLVRKVMVHTADRVLISFGEYNIHTTAGSSRATLHFSLDQLRALAEDPVWLS